MSRWRAAAIERLPEFRDLIASSRSLMALWIELHMKFEDAYRPPQNDDLIRRIYGYASWCLNAPRGGDASHDPVTAVLAAFYEHVPTLPAAREDMPRWLDTDFVARNKGAFSYLIGDEAFEELLVFMNKNRSRYGGRIGNSSHASERKRRGENP